jgi:AbrB family looped-hinge helix DNA binding protein
MLWVSDRGKTIMRRSVVNAKGQVTIPAELREQLEIKPGTRVTWFEEKGRLVLAPMTSRRLKGIRGFLKPKPGEPSAFEESFKDRARERRREDIKAAQYDQEFKKKADKAEKIMGRYPKTLRALAK